VCAYSGKGVVYLTMGRLMRKNLVVDGEKVRELARRRGTSESEAVRQAVDFALAADEYAGARSGEDARHLDRMVAAMQRIGRVITPTAEEWALAGRLIARHIRQYGSLRARDHLADVLILLSAARLRGTVLTANGRHFETWATLAVAAGLDVTVTPIHPEWRAGR
jgi:hypothetical protein